MNVVERVHAGYVHPRRLRVLAGHFARLLPQGARVLNVGAGDGRLAQMVSAERPDVVIRGLDVLVRGGAQVPIDAFDGRTLPLGDGSVDAVLFIDVLHHADDPLELVREAARVSRGVIIIKDRALDGFLAGPTLRFMDRIGNARHRVALPFNYWPREKWLAVLDRLGLSIVEWRSALGLYPRPAAWLFERSLHFIAAVRVTAPTPPYLERMYKPIAHPARRQ
jgi:SAM-dependent methyltransferase